MKTDRPERTRQDIAEAFDFVRFLIKNPRMLQKIRNGAEIRIVPAPGGATKPFRVAKKVQAFSSEMTFRPL